MIKWEYLHVEIVASEEKHLQDHLNDYGNKGWEAFFMMIVEWKEVKKLSTGSGPVVIRSASRWALVFKRPLEA